MKKVIIIFGIVVGCILLILLYFFKAEVSPLTVSIGNMFNLPIASIDDSWIRYRDFQTQVDALRVITETDPISERELRSKVWEKIVNDFTIRHAASERNIAVNIAAREEIALQFGIDITSDEFKRLSEVYDNDTNELYESIIDPIVLELQLTQSLVMDQNNDTAIYIQNIKRQLDADPKKFTELRAEHLTQYNFSSTTDEILLTESDFQNAGLIEYFDSFKEGSISGVIGSYDGYRIYSIQKIFIEPERTYQLAEIYAPANLLEPILAQKKNDLKIKIFAPLLIQI